MTRLAIFKRSNDFYRVEVYNDTGDCIASRIAHSLIELYEVLEELKKLVE